MRFSVILGTIEENGDYRYCYEVTIEDSDRYNRNDGSLKDKSDTYLAIEKALQRLECEKGLVCSIEDVHTVEQCVHGHWKEVYTGGKENGNY